MTQAHSRLASIVRAQAVPLLDLTPGFTKFHEADPTHRALFFERDKHFTPLGHCLAAELIARWVTPSPRGEALLA